MRSPAIPFKPPEPDCPDDLPPAAGLTGDRETVVSTARVVVSVEDALQEMDAAMRESLSSRVRSARAQMTAQGRSMRRGEPQDSNWLSGGSDVIKVA